MKRKSTGVQRLDEQESIFVEEQLQEVKTQTYDQKLKPLKALALLPVNTDADPGAEEIKWYSYKSVGFAKVISDYSRDLPRVDVYKESETAKVHDIGVSYGYTFKEIRKARMANENLDGKRATAARRAIDQKIDRIAFYGLPENNIPGFLNYPGVLKVTLPADGNQNGGTNSRLWAHKTDDQIIRDVNLMVDAIILATNKIEEPDTLALPWSRYNYISNFFMGSNKDRSVLEHIQANNAMIKNITWLTELEDSGEGGTARMICWCNDDEHLEVNIPDDFTQYEEQIEGLEYYIPCTATIAGTLIFYPLSMSRADGF